MTPFRKTSSYRPTYIKLHKPVIYLTLKFNVRKKTSFSNEIKKLIKIYTRDTPHLVQTLQKIIPKTSEIKTRMSFDNCREGIRTNTKTMITGQYNKTSRKLHKYNITTINFNITINQPMIRSLQTDNYDTLLDARYRSSISLWTSHEKTKTKVLSMS